MVIPMIMFFFHMTTKESIAVSSFAIVASCLASFFQTFKLKHPEKDACIIDYNLASIMMPTVIVGSFIGAFLNVIMPSLVITITMCLLHLILSVQSGIKFVHIYKKENAQKKLT